MAVDEQRRKSLHDALERTLGDEEAATLMEHLPRASEPELVTDATLKAEVTHLRLEIRAEMANLRAEVERMGRRVITWTSTMVVASAGLAIAAGRLV